MKVIGIIPARYGSTRFPGKPLIDIGGVSMIMRVVRQAQQCDALCDVIVATDDERIVEHVDKAGEKVVLTSVDHASGTDRCLEALRKTGSDAGAVLNIQGDEPFVDPGQLSVLCNLISGEGVEIATLAKQIEESAVLEDPNKVKVIVSPTGRALYFSRHPIPYQKGVPRDEWISHYTYYRHLGLYAYRREVLEAICLLAPSALERAESLEQLRWLEAGYSIHVAETTIETPAIDTPEDLRRLSFPGQLPEQSIK